MENETFFGFLNIYKPVGMTSHDVVGVLRRILKMRQIGHTGTLDPFAEGVLPIAVGKATRLIEYLDDDKAYIGRFNFGKSTTTYDIEGDTVETFDGKVTKEEIEKNLPKGKILQYPPIYSAKKVNGKKLYEYAREGKEVEIKPCEVNIYSSALLEFNEKENWADIYIKCSKGTYIRSIANDLGKALNNGCYLSKLERVQAGLFKVDTAIKLEDLTLECAKEKMLNPIDYLPLTKQEINDGELTRVRHGLKIYNKTGMTEGNVLLHQGNTLIAIAEVDGQNLKVKKVLSVE